MSLISRGFGVLNKIITRGFFQSEKAQGFLSAKTSVYPALTAQTINQPVLTAETSVYAALEAKANVIN